MNLRTGALLLIFLSGCAGGDASASSDAGSSACSTRFSGNYTDAVSGDETCPSLEQSAGSAADDWVLKLSVQSSVSGANNTVKIDLGPSPAPGTYTDGTVSTWSAVGVGDTGCEYSAGATAVPSGGFTLTLSELSIDPGSPVAHGTLSILEHVSAPQGVDCGAGDTETLDFEF